MALGPLGATALAAMALAAHSGGVAAEDFYSGKRITIAIGFTSGGGHDTYARMLARYFGDHVPGKPTVVVQNMPGAASSKAVTFLNSGAPTDGTMIALFGPDIIPLSLIDPKKINIDFRKLAWIGSIARDERLCYAWHTAPYKSWKDLFDGAPLIVGASGPGSNAYNTAAILKNMVKAKVQIISGYPGSSEQRIAVERGELNGACGSWGSIPKGWVRDNRIVPLVAFSRSRTAGMGNIPFVGDLVKEEREKKILTLLLGASETARPYVASLSVPNDRIETLRRAFDSTMKDPAFVAEAEKGKRPLSPLTGDEAARNTADVYSAGPDIVAAAREVIK
ncbi:MAG: hypothetical protein RLZ98_3046 [Pseudomonadota bacterium]|jgi:tripartite-type tricarboxylate transporter receptor subunit TctC